MLPQVGFLIIEQRISPGVFLLLFRLSDLPRPGWILQRLSAIRKEKIVFKEATFIIYIVIACIATSGVLLHDFMFLLVRIGEKYQCI